MPALNPHVLTTITRGASKEQDAVRGNMPNAFAQVIEGAGQVVKDKAELGPEDALQLLREYEKQLKELIDTEAKLIAGKSVLDALPGSLPPNVDAAGLQVHFLERVEQQQQQGRGGGGGGERYARHPKMRELKKMFSDLAGERSDEPENDEPVMTQAERTNFKCPILQIDMTPTGEMRPMTHNERCVVSYRAAKDYYQGQGKPCVQPGCNAIVKFNQLKEFKEFVRDLRAAQADAQGGGGSSSGLHDAEDVG